MVCRYRDSSAFFIHLVAAHEQAHLPHAVMARNVEVGVVGGAAEAATPISCPSTCSEDAVSSGGSAAARGAAESRDWVNLVE